MQANQPPIANKKGTRVASIAACVFCVALAVYVLSFSGLPISDDEGLYASAARNLAMTGTLSAGQLTGNARLAGSYHGVEPAFPALASLWYRLFLHSAFGHLQTLYLLPMLCTALSAALMVVIAVQLGFPSLVGAVTALLFALSSMAWPYARTLFREPLVALLLLGSLSAFLWLIQEGHRFWASVLIAFLLVALLVLLVLTRVGMAVVGAVLVLALPFVHPALRGHAKRGRIFLLGSALVAIGTGAVLGAFRATDAAVFYRFTGGFVTDTLTKLNTTSHAHLVEALIAPLVSPWKGLLWYSPVCLLGLISAVMNVRRQPVLTLLTLTVLIALLLEQALVYDDLWWTPTWGSRFLLPAIPLLILAALPALDRLAKWRRGGWLILGALFAIGFLIQLPAVLFDSAKFTAITYQNARGTFPQSLLWDVSKTPIIAQWQSAAWHDYDLLLVRVAGAQPIWVFTTCALAVVTLLLGSLGLWWASNGNDKRSAIMLTFSLAMSFLAMAALLKASTYDPAYEMPAFEPVCAYLEEHMAPTDVLIVQPYPGPAWQYLMNAECGQRVWYSLPYDRQSSTVEAVLQKIPSGARYWLIEQFWSDDFSAGVSSLTPAGDRLLQQHIFDSPYHLFLGAYLRGQAK